MDMSITPPADGGSAPTETAQSPAGTRLLFNTLLRQEGIDPASVRLLRHQDRRAAKGRSPYALWRDDRDAFERYQSRQSLINRTRLSAPYWASFVVTPDGAALLAGFYAVSYRGLLEADEAWPHADGIDRAGECDVFDLALEDRISDLAGRLVIEWGAGVKMWIQRADLQNKPIVELRQAFREPPFPGALAFATALSKIEGLPAPWTTALSATARHARPGRSPRIVAAVGSIQDRRTPEWPSGSVTDLLCGGQPALDAFASVEREAVKDPVHLREAISPWLEPPGCDAQTELDACRTALSVAELREALCSEFEAFNLALLSTGQMPDTYPEVHARQLASRIKAASIEIANALRAVCAERLMLPVSNDMPLRVVRRHASRQGQRDRGLDGLLVLPEAARE